MLIRNEWQNQGRIFPLPGEERLFWGLPKQHYKLTLEVTVPTNQSDLDGRGKLPIDALRDALNLPDNYIFALEMRKLVAKETGIVLVLDYA